MARKPVKQSKFTFLDAYGLTKAALNGEKTQRRMIASWKRNKDGSAYISEPLFEVGDEIAIIQPYIEIPELANQGLEKETGWRNKMFVKPSLMPRKVRITGRRLERLCDITEEDALAEGVKVYKCDGLPDLYSFVGCKGQKTFRTAREAFGLMCDGLFGVGMWRANPNVYVYEFEVI